MALALIAGLVTTAQNIDAKLQKSDVFKINNKYSGLMSADDGDSGNSVIAYRTDKGYLFQRYDATLKSIKSFEYVTKDKNVIDVIVTNDKAVVIDYTYNKKAKKYVCSAALAETADFNFMQKELFTISGKERDFLPVVRKGAYEFDQYATSLVSSDKSLFAIYIDIDDKDDKADFKKLYIYDLALNLKKEHEYDNDTKGHVFGYENMELSNNGDIYLLGSDNIRVKNAAMKEAQFTWQLTKFSGNDVKTIPLENAGQSVRQLRMAFKKDDIGVAGFYAAKDDSKIMGICYFSVNPASMQIQNSKFSPFTLQFMADKYGKDKGKPLSDIEFRDIFVTNDNSVIITAEEEYSTYNGNRSTYSHDDIIAAKIADNGGLTWARNINKKQWTTGSSRHLSFTALTKGNDTYIFVNTGEKPKELSKGRLEFTQKSTSNSNLTGIKLDTDGNLDYKELLDDKQNEVPFMVRDGVINKQKGIIYFLGENDSKKQLLKVSL